ncbi:MAG: hypothetical protein RR461_05790, partial [Angelakisella sp.]
HKGAEAHKKGIFFCKVYGFLHSGILSNRKTNPCIVRLKQVMRQFLPFWFKVTLSLSLRPANWMQSDVSRFRRVSGIREEQKNKLCANFL